MTTTSLRTPWRAPRQALIGALAIFGLGLGPPATATPIDPGFDLFQTATGSTSVLLDPDGPGGIDPFAVLLRGEPLANLGAPFVNLGPTDTIVKRKQGIAPFDVGDSAPIDIEIVALSLRSVAPVDLGGTLFDLDVIGGSLLGVQSPLGQMTVNHTHAFGGTFDALLPVSALLTFTEVGNPANTFRAPFADDFRSAGVWCHEPIGGAIMDPRFPAGAFFPGVFCPPDQTDPTRPTQPGKRLTIEQALLAQHGVVPAHIPEPGTVLLVAIGILLLARARTYPPGSA